MEAKTWWQILLHQESLNDCCLCCWCQVSAWEWAAHDRSSHRQVTASAQPVLFTLVVLRHIEAPPQNLAMYMQLYVNTLRLVSSVPCSLHVRYTLRSNAAQQLAPVVVQSHFIDSPFINHHATTSAPCVCKAFAPSLQSVAVYECLTVALPLLAIVEVNAACNISDLCITSRSACLDVLDAVALNKPLCRLL